MAVIAATSSRGSTSECTLKFFTMLETKGKLEVLKWCMKVGLIASRYECPKCGSDMKLEKNNAIDGYAWRCRKQGAENTHDVMRSVRINSWFSNSHLSICDVMRVTRFWFGRCMIEFVMNELNLSNRTIVDWYTFCREVCMVDVLRGSKPIGGPGLTVEIDESKFGRMKFGRGRPVLGQWIFGGLERGTNKCFFLAVEGKAKTELLNVIRDWVLPGSIVVSDCFQRYDCFSDKAYVRLSIEHGLIFKDPDVGARATNTVEAVWSTVKMYLRKNTSHTEGEFDSYLAEYVWRKARGHSMNDETFKAFLAAVIQVYPPAERDVKKKRNDLCDDVNKRNYLCDDVKKEMM